jgi:hypothetical protein
MPATESGHQPNRIYIDQAGNLHINGSVLFADELGTQITGTAIAVLTGRPASVTITPAAGGANVSLVTIQVKDSDGNNITSAVVLEVWLSDAATGAGETGTTASGAVAAGASGTDLLTITSKKRLRVLTSATGAYILSITDTGKTGFYVAVQRGEKLSVSAQLTAGNYG